MNNENFCFEISERHRIPDNERMQSLCQSCHSHGFRMAIDDFGTGFSGMQLLYRTEPDYLKIDQFFVQGIAADPRKAAFAGSIVSLAHLMGIRIIAEGIECREDFQTCRALGCDFVQGFLFGRPAPAEEAHSGRNSVICMLNSSERRGSESDQKVIAERMEWVEPVILPQSTMNDIFELFRRRKENTFFPAVNRLGEPLGIIREQRLKNMSIPLLDGSCCSIPERANNQDLLTRVPCADINNSLETVLQIYSIRSDAEGIFITDNGRYRGFLTTRALLAAINEKNMAVARDMNPLSRLPGNTVISEYLGKLSGNRPSGCYCVYFDFNNFKPFNDVYGFRHGDRAIMLFADNLRELEMRHGCFIGHIGGDDFFAAFDGNTGKEDILEVVKDIINTFALSAVSLYNETDRANGGIVATDRYGQIQKFSLLSVCAAILHVPAGCGDHDIARYTGWRLAALKKEAKASPDGICYDEAPFVASSVFDEPAVMVGLSGLDHRL